MITYVLVCPVVSSFVVMTVWTMLPVVRTEFVVSPTVVKAVVTVVESALSKIGKEYQM